MTRGFMGLLSESKDHLDDSEARIRGERVALSGVGEPAPLVEAQGAVVAFGDPQLEPLELAKARPVDDRAQECRPRGRSSDAPDRGARRRGRRSVRLPRRGAWSGRRAWSPTP